jgi:hypothetical protein
VFESTFNLLDSHPLAIFIFGFQVFGCDDNAVGSLSEDICDFISGIYVKPDATNYIGSFLAFVLV